MYYGKYTNTFNRYLYRAGKYRSEYIKLSELVKHPDAPPRPFL